MTSGKAVRKSSSFDAHLAAIENIEALYASGTVQEEHQDRNNDPNIRSLKRVWADFHYDGKAYRAKFTVKEFENPHDSNRLYSIEALETEDAPERTWVAASPGETGLTSTPQSGAQETNSSPQGIEQEEIPHVTPDAFVEGSSSSLGKKPIEGKSTESGIERKGKNTEQSNASFSIGNNAFQWTSEEERQKFEDLAFEQAKQSRIVNTDDIRPLLPGYEQADPLIRDAQYHPASRDITTRIVERMLAEPVVTGKVLILAGGSGSGKSTVLGMLSLQSFDLILDTTLSHLPSAKKLIAEIQASGRKEDVIYVHRPFDRAFESVVDRYLLGRTKGSPRVVPLDIVINAHIGAQETILNQNNDWLTVIDNGGGLGETRAISLEDLRDERYIQSNERVEQTGTDREDHRGFRKRQGGGGGGNGQATGRAEAKARLRAEGERILRERYEEGLLTKEEFDTFLGPGRFSPQPAKDAGKNDDQVERAITGESAVVSATQRPKDPSDQSLVAKGAVPDGSIYSTVFEIKLDPSVFGRSDKVHFNRANASLYDALRADADFSALMEQLIPGVADQVSSVGGRQNPSGYTWHHDATPGVMQLVPRAQHTAGSIFWRALHPDPGAAGGYSIWATPAGAPKRKSRKKNV